MDEFTTTDRGTITLAGRDYTVSQVIGPTTTNFFLTGPKGARYQVSPFLTTTKQRVLSCKTFAPLRVNGREVLVDVVADGTLAEHGARVAA